MHCISTSQGHAGGPGRARRRPSKRGRQTSDPDRTPRVIENRLKIDPKVQNRREKNRSSTALA
eukprot:351302-Chlamydomonas_euryale.AAC.3